MGRTIIALSAALLLTSFMGCTREEKRATPEDAGKPAVPSPSAGSRPTSDSVTVEEKVEDSSVDALLFDDPIFPNGSQYMLLPVRLDEDDDDGSDATLIDRVGSSVGGSRGGVREAPKNVANIIFVDRGTRATHPLLDRPALIERFEILGGATDVAGKGAGDGPIIYAIVERDTDGDSTLTDDDEAVCYISDLAGGGLQRITPEGVSIRNWYRDGNAIYLRALVDANHDGSFDDDDPQEQILRYDIGGTVPAVRTVSDSTVAATIAIAKKMAR